MAGSDITVSSLVAVGDVKGVKLSWSYTDPRNGAIPSIALGAVEVWAATSNDRGHGSFAKVGEGVSNFSHAGLNRGDVRYYWIKARNVRGSYGDWHPSSATAGVVGTEVSGDVLLLPNGYWKEQSGLMHQWGYAEVSAGSALVDYSIAFPSGVLNLLATLYGSEPAGRFLSVAVVVDSLSQCYITLQDSAGNGLNGVVYWRAIGF